METSLPVFVAVGLTAGLIKSSLVYKDALQITYTQKGTKKPAENQAAGLGYYGRNCGVLTRLRALRLDGFCQRGGCGQLVHTVGDQRGVPAGQLCLR